MSDRKEVRRGTRDERLDGRGTLGRGSAGGVRHCTRKINRQKAELQVRRKLLRTKL